jgi:hypothetical protein
LADEVLAAVDFHDFQATGHHFSGAAPGILAHVIPALDGRYLVSVFSNPSVGDLRLISAFFGIATVCLMFPLCAELGIPKLGLVAGAALAVMPWHIYYSRLFLPGSEYLFLTVLSLVLLLAGLRRGTLLLLMASALTAIVSIYLYPVSIVTTPLFVAGVVFFRWSEFKRLGPSRVLAPLALGAILLAPYLADHLAATDSVVANQNSVIDVKMIWNHAMPVFQMLLYFVQNWASYITPQFSLISGDPNPAHSIQIMGEVGWVTGFLGLVGILVGVTRRTRLHILLLCWLVAYPIADAITYYDAAGNSVRGLPGSIVWALWAAIGVAWLIEVFRQRYQRGIAALIGVAVLFQCVVFASFYFGPYSKRYEYLFETGYTRIYLDLERRGLANLPITLHAGYQRDAMLEYFSGYKLHASQVVLACYDLPFNVVHDVELPRVFIVREDPGFSAQAGCIQHGLTERDTTALSQDTHRKAEVIDMFANDSSGDYHTAILYLHD